MQRGQVFAGFYCDLGPLKDLRGGVVAQGFKPEFFDLPQLLRLAEGRVVLVVVIETKQRKDLINGLDQGGVLAASLSAAFSRPRRCR